MIGKLSPARKNTWVQITEFPDETLALTGFSKNPQQPGEYFYQGIRFSLEAVKELIPLLQEWVKVKEAEKDL